METIRRTKIVDLLKREDFGAMVNVKGCADKRLARNRKRKQSMEKNMRLPGKKQ